MGIRNSFGQVYNGGDHYLNINTSRVSDDSAEITTVIYKEGGPVYVVQMQGDKILTLTVDGRNVPADGLGRYQTVIDTIRDRVKEAKEQAKRDRAQAERNRQQAGRDREQAERDRQQADKDRVQAERDRQQANHDREQAGRDREQAERDRQQAERDRIQAEEDRKRVDSLITDLVADKIVPDRESVHSLTVNVDEIIVNGKRLPEALEKKYISKYVKKGFSMSYRNDD